MKVGLMLRHVGMRGGIGSLTRNLVQALLETDPSTTFHLYYDSPAALGRYAHAPNAVETVIRASSKLAWDQMAVPRRLARDGIDVVLNPKLSVPLLGSVPSIFYLHGPEMFVAPSAYPRLDRVQGRFLYRRYLKAAAATIVQTEDARDKAVALMGADPARLHVIAPSHGPEFRPLPREEAETARRAFGLPEHFLLFVGGVYPIKNFSRLVEALSLVRAELGDAMPPLVAVGFQRWKSGELAAAVAAAGLTDKIVFLGWVEQDDLIRLYNLATAFLLPSLYEGFGLAALEAMACGCPVIASDTGGTRATGEGVALLVDPLHPSDIARGIVALLSDPSRRAAMRRAGIARAAAYSWDRTSDGIVRLLHRVAAERPHRTPTLHQWAGPVTVVSSMLQGLALI